MQIAGLSRGDLPVRLVGSEVWVPAAALRANEANYGAGRATCDGEEYVRLSPALNVQYDPSELTLTVQAAPALLAGGELDFAGTFGDPLPSLPAFSVSGRVDVQRPAGEPLAGLLGVGASLQTGRFRAGAEATLSGTLTGEARSLRLGGSLSAEAVLDDVWTVGGVLRLGPGGLGSGFSGLEVRARSPEGTLVPELALELPLEAVVTLLYEERQIARFRAPAGRFVLRNLPLAPEGELLVFIQDERGTRLVTLPLSPTQVRLREGAFAVRAQAGLETGRPILRASGAYGLTGALTVQGQAELRADQQSVAASLGGPLGPGRGRVGGTVVRSAAAGVAASAQLGYAVPLGPVNAAADLNLPVAPLRAPSVSLGLSYADLRAQASLTGSYDFALREGAVRLSGSYRLTPEWTLQGQGTYRTSGGYGLGLGLTYRLPNGWVLGTGAAADGSVPFRSDGAGGSLSGRGVVSARLGEHEVALTGPGPWGVRYRHTGVWPLSVQADQTGFLAAQGELGLTWTGGRLLRGVPAEGVSLLVRTGVPGLAVRVSGGNFQRADAQGDLFFTGLPAGGTVVLSVDAAPLSFEVNVTDSEQPLQLGLAGVSLYDWSANFQLRRWVRFVWPDGSAAAYAVVTVDGRIYSADLDGNVLLDRRLAPGLAVTLRSEDGARRCTLRLTAAEEQRCPALEEDRGA